MLHSKAMSKINKNYDSKGNASHYSDQRINVIRMLEVIWGTHATMTFCEMNAFKYRMRMGKKDNPEQELIKIDWYEKMAKYLREKYNALDGLSPDQMGMYPEFLKMLEDEIPTNFELKIIDDEDTPEP